MFLRSKLSKTTCSKLVVGAYSLVSIGEAEVPRRFWSSGYLGLDNETCLQKQSSSMRKLNNYVYLIFLKWSLRYSNLVLLYTQGWLNWFCLYSNVLMLQIWATTPCLCGAMYWVEECVHAGQPERESKYHVRPKICPQIFFLVSSHMWVLEFQTWVFWREAIALTCWPIPPVPSCIVSYGRDWECCSKHAVHRQAEPG